MTLIELLAALLILSLLLSSLLVSRGRMLRLGAAAQHRLDAIAAADALLAGWWLSEKQIPHAASGECPGDRYRWETRSDRVLSELSDEMGVIQLQLRDQDGDEVLLIELVQAKSNQTEASP